MESAEPKAADVTQKTTLFDHPKNDPPKKEELESMIEAIQQASFYSGPIPSPEVLQQFKDVIEDAPERILKMAEKSQDHRHAINHLAVRAETRSQYFAFFFSIIAIIATLACVYLKETAVASILGGSTIIMVVRYFMGGIAFRMKDKGEKKGNSDIPEQSEQQ